VRSLPEVPHLVSDYNTARGLLDHLSTISPSERANSSDSLPEPGHLVDQFLEGK
jgi:hypothetical protein